MRYYEDVRNNFKTTLRASQILVFRNPIIWEGRGAGGMYSHFVLESFAGRHNNSNEPHAARYSPVWYAW